MCFTNHVRDGEQLLRECVPLGQVLDLRHGEVERRRCAAQHLSESLVALLPRPDSHIANDLVLHFGGQCAELGRLDVNIRRAHLLNELLQLGFGRQPRVRLVLGRHGRHVRFRQAIWIVLSKFLPPLLSWIDRVGPSC